jgi:hypothetical protein
MKTRMLLVLFVLVLSLSACAPQRSASTPPPEPPQVVEPVETSAIPTLEPLVAETATLAPTSEPTLQPTPNGDMATLQSQLTQAVAIVQTQGASMVLTAAAGQQGTPTPGATNGTPVVGASNTPIPAVDCQVKTYIKDAGGYHQVTDAALVTGHWNNGNGQTQVSKICAFVKPLGIDTFDIHYDSLANNVSALFVPSALFTPQKAEELARFIGSPRVGYIHAWKGGFEAIDFVNDQACGTTTLIHIYDRSDWNPNPSYDCISLLRQQATPTASPTPQQ